VCIDALCYRRDADAGVAALDAGADTGAPNREACNPLDTVPCTGARNCESAYAADAVCRMTCTEHSECAEPNRCVRTVEGSSRQCTLACDPLTGAGCLGDDSCDHLYFQVEETYLQAWECRHTGTMASGAPCATDEPMQCGRGLTCSSDSGGAFCRPLCDIDDDTCADGFDCHLVDGAPAIGGRLYGACTPSL